MISGVLGESVYIEWTRNENEYDNYKSDMKSELRLNSSELVKLGEEYTQDFVDTIIRGRKDYFKTDTNISEKQKKYCRCVSHVKCKQSDKCIKLKFDRNIEKCYNPYTTCTSRVGRDEKYCDKYYDYNKIPLNEINKIFL